MRRWSPAGHGPDSGTDGWDDASSIRRGLRATSRNGVQADG